MIARVAALLVACAAGGAAAQEFRVVGTCRDGQPHGVYELRGAGGQLRVSGAFNRGKRTSSFLYWSAQGVRVAHVPYDEGRKSGTLSLWYADARRDGAPRQKLEAGYAAGLRNGVTRSWHPDGGRRTVVRYENDEAVEVAAWSASGAPLDEAAAREMVARDRAEDERYYASLDALVAAHLPRCDKALPPGQRAAGPDRIGRSP
jgi:antitoxin component YwqK of YwqJK toxin-antitoxin module